MTFTVKAVCERYGVSEGTVLGCIRSGELRAVNVGRRSSTKKPRWRITQKALEAFEQLRAAQLSAPRMRRRKRPADVIEFY